MNADTANGFVPGMRERGTCPKHPGQPFYHCPECSKERRQEVGDEIADSLKHRIGDGQQALVTDPMPIHVTQRALNHLVTAIRTFRRNRLEGRVQRARDRVQQMPEASDPESESSQRYLERLEQEAAAAGVNVDSFEVVVLVFLDVTGVSGIHPKIELAELKGSDEDKDYRRYDQGSVQFAVERQHINYLRGLIIDWHDRLDSSGFVLRHQKGDWSVQDR